jgi:hypothetical protein
MHREATKVQKNDDEFDIASEIVRGTRLYVRVNQAA